MSKVHAVCYKALCTRCYEAALDLKFQKALQENDEGSKFKKKSDEKIFLHARDGDMHCSPFQCGTCLFINLL